MRMLTHDTPAPRTAGISRYRRPDRDFVIVANSFARSKYSARAVKVGLYVLSHTEDYVLTQSRIASEIELSESTVQGALRDLESYGLLVRHEVRNERGHRAGTRMHVSDIPFTDDERADLGKSLTVKSLAGKSLARKSTPPKKTTSNQKIKKTEEPSGGPAAAEPTAEHVEEPVSETLELFAVDKPRAARREPEGAAAVVAAFVVAFRTAHGDNDPSPRDKGRVARDAKQLLTCGQAEESELVQVAARLGTGDFANLGAELAMSRRTTRKSGAPGMAQATPYTDPQWERYAGPSLIDWSEDEEAHFQAVLAKQRG